MRGRPEKISIPTARADSFHFHNRAIKDSIVIINDTKSNMTQITNTGELDAWCEVVSHRSIILLLSRAALRVLPYASNYNETELRGNRERFILFLLRAHALCAHSAYKTFPESQIVSIARALRHETEKWELNDQGYAAAYAVIYLTDVVRLMRNCVPVAEMCVRSIGKSNPQRISDFWEAVSFDAKVMAAPTFSASSYGAHLWPVNGFNWVQESSTIVSFNQMPREGRWEVWRTWCYDRYLGFNPVSRPFIEELEHERVLIPNEYWEKGPAHVNAIIAELEAKYRQGDGQKGQLPGPSRFVVGDDGLITAELLGHDDASKLLEQLHQTIKELSSDLLEELGAGQAEHRTVRRHAGMANC